MSETIFDRIRNTCAQVAGRATLVRIDYERIPAYAASLPAEKALNPSSISCQ